MGYERAMRRPLPRFLRLVLPLLACAALLGGCGPKKYVLLSPEDNYSDDPTLDVEVERVAEVETGRTEVVLQIVNRRDAPLALADAKATMIDADEKPMKLLSQSQVVVAPAETRTGVFTFDTTGAAKGAFEMKLEIAGARIWPIIFSTEKPPDFKPAPEPPGGPGQGPPRGPGGL